MKITNHKEAEQAVKKYGCTVVNSLGEVVCRISDLHKAISICDNFSRQDWCTIWCKGIRLR